jgi:hypothetical protein
MKLITRNNIIDAICSISQIRNSTPTVTTTSALLQSIGVMSTYKLGISLIQRFFNKDTFAGVLDMYLDEKKRQEKVLISEIPQECDKKDDALTFAELMNSWVPLLFILFYFILFYF